MRIILFILCLTIVGCSTVTGPISGKKYTVIEGQIINAPAYTKELREDYLKKNPSLDPRISYAINKEQVLIGMTKDQVKASWGLPQKINTTTTRFIVFEQWIYNIGSYVYFENDKLYSTQTFP